MICLQNAVVSGLEVFGHSLPGFIVRLLNDIDCDDNVDISHGIVTYDEVLSWTVIFIF